MGNLIRRRKRFDFAAAGRRGIFFLSPDLLPVRGTGVRTGHPKTGARR